MADVRKLYRSRTNRQVAGVCGGLAEHFNMDATLIRVLFIVLAVLGGPASSSTLPCGSSFPRNRRRRRGLCT